jgi:hypothetical protein
MLFGAKTRLIETLLTTTGLTRSLDSELIPIFQTVSEVDFSHFAAKQSAWL